MADSLLRLVGVVGPDGIEPSTSPLSGVRSSHLSYGPSCVLHCRPNTGGAGRVRTGDLLSANQALSQLSYSPFFGPHQVPLAPPSRIYRGQLDTGAKDIKPSTTFRFTPICFKWRSGSVLTTSSEEPVAVYGMERLPPTRPRCTLKRFWLSETPSTVSLRK